MSKQRASVVGLGARLKDQGAVEVDAHPIDAFAEPEIINVPLSAVTPNPKQPRKYFDEAALNDLAQSIKRDGLLQPIIVKRQAEDRYLLVAGERRYRACQLAGIAKVKAFVTLGDPLEIAIIENLQRENLSPIEEAEALSELQSSHRYTQEQLAQVVGKSRPTVTEILSLATLPDVIKAECRTSDISTKHQLLQVVREHDGAKQMALWESIKSGTVTTVRAARLARQPAEPTKTFSRRFPKLGAAKATITVTFPKARVSDEEILTALKEAVKEQRKQMEE